MTLIELFDPCQLENAAGVMLLRPERAVYIGYADEMTESRRSALTRFLKKNAGTRFVEYVNVPHGDFTEIERAVAYIANKYADSCVFDLSGGDELIAAAFGAVAQVMKLCMVKSDVNGMTVLPLKNAQSFAEHARIYRDGLSVGESVALYGGAVLSERDSDCRRVLSENDRRDINALWDICRRNTRLWNKQISVLSSLEQYGRNGNKINIYLKSERFKNIELPSVNFMSDLMLAGLVSGYRVFDGRISYRYRNDFVRSCMSKAGNILENYVYMCAVMLSEREKDFFGDIAVGVSADWDGVPQSGTKNEIDVVAMHGFVPVFISCKNGGAKKEALYELDTVARHYGGEHAVKILVTTSDRANESARLSLIERAENMGIAVIGDTDVISAEKFIARLRAICVRDERKNLR